MIIGVVIAIVVVLTILLLVRNNRTNDPVDSFRRQIDALSPEARKPTIDQVRRVDEDSGETGENGS